ncbi:potassium-transporting ATPase subunit F [Brevibacillus massiliensis]
MILLYACIVFVFLYLVYVLVNPEKF